MENGENLKKLTNRELEVLDILVLGLNNLEISERMNVSSHTIKAYVASIYKKLGVTNRVQAAVLYWSLKGKKIRNQ